MQHRNKINLVFISHEASLTGAPILLLRLIREVKKTGRFGITILIIKDGPLRTEFAKEGEILLWEEPLQTVSTRVKNKILGKIGLESQTSRSKHFESIRRYLAFADIIFANTIVSAKPLKQLGIKKKIVFYIHELSIVTNALMTADEMEFIRSSATKVLVPAKFVSDYLQAAFAFRKEQTALLRYYIPPTETPIATTRKFRAGACGSLVPRKGYDLFVQLVYKLVNRYAIKDISFSWIGVNTESVEYLIFKGDLEKTGLSKYVEIIAEKPDVQTELAKLDVLLLPSREDAFPLVVLEAAACGIPTICFNEAGGIPEFVESDAGICVDYLDLDAFCNAVIMLRDNDILRKRLGENAKLKLEEYSDSSRLVSEFINATGLN